MIGLESKLPAGYQGYVFHRPTGADDDEGNEDAAQYMPQ